MAIGFCQVKAACENCGETSVRSNKITVVLDAQQRRQWARHKCPRCKTIGITELFYKETVRMLLSKGAYLLQLTRTAEECEPKPNSKISADEVLGFIGELETADIMQRVISTARDIKLVERP